MKANGQWNPAGRLGEHRRYRCIRPTASSSTTPSSRLSHKNSGQFFFALDARTRQDGLFNAAISRAGDSLHSFFAKDDAELLIARSGAKGLETVKTYAVADSATLVRAGGVCQQGFS